MLIAANNQLQRPLAQDDMLLSSGHAKIAADEDEREAHQDEIERVHRQRPRANQPNNCQYLELTPISLLRKHHDRFQNLARATAFHARSVFAKLPGDAPFSIRVDGGGDLIQPRQIVY